MEINRNEQICIDRENGMTFKKIGLKYGISTERARQICSKKKKMIKKREYPLYRDFEKYGDVGKKISNILRVYGYTTEQQVIEDVKSCAIMKIRLIGKKSIQIICKQYNIPLPSYIYIKDSEKVGD